MTASIAAPRKSAALLPEDSARADFYALISRLFFAGPDAALLAAIAHAGTGAAPGNGEELPLPFAWKTLSTAASTADAEAARQEYDQVFVGTGKAEITLYASHYLAPVMQERVLVRLRQEMAEMGLARSAGTTEYEDHISGLCEIMRHLIVSFGSDDVAVQKQKTFYLGYLGPWYADFCAAVTASPNTNFYRHVAGFARVFLDVEGSSFQMI
jgi:TorA maturation chaperone TorD